MFAKLSDLLYNIICNRFQVKPFLGDWPAAFQLSLSVRFSKYTAGPPARLSTTTFIFLIFENLCFESLDPLWLQDIVVEKRQAGSPSLDPCLFLSNIILESPTSGCSFHQLSLQNLAHSEGQVYSSCKYYWFVKWVDPVGVTRNSNRDLEEVD